MNGMIKSWGVFLCAASLFAGHPARADIPPPDACQTKNAVCHSAGEAYDEDGVCRAKTCTKGPPGNQFTYECLLCEASSGAAGASGAAGESGNAGAAGDVTRGGAAGAVDNGSAGKPDSVAGGSGSQGGTGGAPSKGGSAGVPLPAADDQADEGGCSIAAVGTEKGLASLMLALGLSALCLSRRRQH